MKEKIYRISLRLCIASIVLFAITAIVSVMANINFLLVVTDKQGITPISAPIIFLALTVVFLLLAIFSSVSEKKADPNESWVNLRKIFDRQRIPFKQ